MLDCLGQTLTRQFFGSVGLPDLSDERRCSEGLGGDRCVRLTDLPGGDLVAAGLEDLKAGTQTVAALLVCVGGPRLRRLGLEVPDTVPDPEDRLYALLARDDEDSAHGRYNALIRRLVSFERAAETLRVGDARPGRP